MVSFIYQSQDDLLTGQEALIDLAFHLLDYCEAPINQKPIYYECLTLIMDRGEFSLNYMGFDQARADLFLQKAERTAFKNESSKMLKSINKKLKVCLNYQNLLYRTLEKVLHKLNQKKLEDKEREFVESFCAIARQSFDSGTTTTSRSARLAFFIPVSIFDTGSIDLL